jgi:hypothetical protein
MRWLALAWLLASTPAQAAVPREFTVQGVLRDSTGKLQSLPVNVTVNLFPMQTGGTALAGPYVANNVPVSNGLFTVTIPDPALESKITAATEVWIEVAVGNDTFPRQKVTTQVYALMCGSAEGFTGGLSGDVSGSQAATKVTKLQGVAVSATAPTTNQVLRFNGTSWAPSAESPGIKTGTIPDGMVLSPSTLTNLGNISFTPPAAGQIMVSVNSATFGSFTHANGIADQISCCLSTVTNSCNGAVTTATIPRSWPTHPGGAEGIEFPFSLTSVFPYAGSGAFTAYLLCQYQTSAGGTTGMYVRVIRTAALYVPQTY